MGQWGFVTPRIGSGLTKLEAKCRGAIAFLAGARLDTLFCGKVTTGAAVQALAEGVPP
jgi:hypothetical protein